MSCCVVHGHSREQYRRSIVCRGGGRRGRAESTDFLAERYKRHPRGPQHPRRGSRTDGLAAASFSAPGSICDTAVLHDASQFRTLRHRWVPNTNNPVHVLFSFSITTIKEKNWENAEIPKHWNGEGKLGSVLKGLWLIDPVWINALRHCQRALTRPLLSKLRKLELEEFILRLELKIKQTFSSTGIYEITV